MKKLNGTKIRDKENLQKSTLYSVPTAMRLKLEEVHVDDPAKDIVNVDFQLKENEYGVYGNEYRPLYLTKGSCKVLDLLCVIVNDEEKRMASYLFDVKSKTGGKDEIPDFIEQLEDGFLHKQAMLQYLSDYQEDEHIGVITRHFDEDSIKCEIERVAKKINEEIENIPILLRQKKEIERVKLKLRKKVFEDFLERKVTIHGRQYELEVHMLQPFENDFVIDFPVKL